MIQSFSVNGTIGPGITELRQEKDNFFYGVSYFHISGLFHMKPSGSLYMTFVDYSKNWNIIKTIQSVANEGIRQLRV